MQDEDVLDVPLHRMTKVIILALDIDWSCRRAESEKFRVILRL